MRIYYWTHSPARSGHCCPWGLCWVPAATSSLCLCCRWCGSSLDCPSFCWPGTSPWCLQPEISDRIGPHKARVITRRHIRLCLFCIPLQNHWVRTRWSNWEHFEQSMHFLKRLWLQRWWWAGRAQERMNRLRDTLIKPWKRTLVIDRYFHLGRRVRI